MKKMEQMMEMSKHEKLGINESASLIGGGKVKSIARYIPQYYSSSEHINWSCIGSYTCIISIIIMQKQLLYYS